MTQSPTASTPSPMLVFETLGAHERTAALKAAIDLDLFTAIGEGAKCVADLARRCQASERGVRILADYLTLLGFLRKEAGAYQLTQDSAVFLDRRSPACIASASNFLTSPMMMGAFSDLTAVVRSGRTALPGRGSIEPDNPIWQEFARSMAPMMKIPAEQIAKLLGADGSERWRVLDLAAGHGMFGIALAKHNPNAEVTAVDWSGVLTMAKENAELAGIADRWHSVAGDAFDVHYGSGYNVALVTNFLHHFGPANVERILKKVRSALAPDGRMVTLEFVPNDDRVSPPGAAAFSLIMLATTVAGDAYTAADYDVMFRRAGFGKTTVHPIEGCPQTVLITERE